MRGVVAGPRAVGPAGVPSLARSPHARVVPSGTRLHAARVRTLIEEQEARNPGEPRLIYGRGTCEHIKPFERAMNAAALQLLQKNPHLVSWDGARLKLAPLLHEARMLLLYGRDDKATVRANS